MSKNTTIAIVAAVSVVAAVVLNPSPERHREKIKDAIAGRSQLESGVCQTNCVTPQFQSAPSGTRPSPNITWKLCSAGFQ